MLSFVETRNGMDVYSVIYQHSTLYYNYLQCKICPKSTVLTVISGSKWAIEQQLSWNYFFENQTTAAVRPNRSMRKVSSTLLLVSKQEHNHWASRGFLCQDTTARFRWGRYTAWILYTVRHHRILRIWFVVFIAIHWSIMLCITTRKHAVQNHSVSNAHNGESHTVPKKNQIAMLSSGSKRLYIIIWK